MLFRHVDASETSKHFKYTFCNEHTVQLTIISKEPQNIVLYHLYEINIYTATEYVPNVFKSTVIEYLGVVLKRTKNSIRVQAGSVNFLFPLVVYNVRPGTDVWIIFEEIKT